MIQPISGHFQSPGDRTLFQIFQRWRCEPPPIGKEAQVCVRSIQIISKTQPT